MRPSAETKASLPTIPWPVRTHPVKILAGEGSLDGLNDELDFLEVDRAVLLCGQNAASGDAYPRVLDLLGERCVGVYTGVQQHTPRAKVYEAAQLVEREQADVLVSLGGGSTSDLAKGVATMLGEGRPIDELHSDFIPGTGYVEQFLKKPKMPQISIPTTLSGADVAAGFGVMGPDHLKHVCRGDYVPARVVFLDPAVTLDTPLDTFLHSGMNGLAHGFEALYSRTGDPLSDALALEAIRLFIDHLPEASKRPEDLEVRLQLQWANVLGGMILSNARMALHHGVSHVLAVGLGLTHGLANSLMLAHVLRFNLEYAAFHLARAANAMGIDTDSMSTLEAGTAAIDRVGEIRRQIGVPERLRDLADAPDDAVLHELAETAWSFERGVHFNPRPITSAGDIYELLCAAY